MANKSTNYEIIQRVKLVIDFLLDGLSRYEILEYTRENWKLSRAQTDIYISRANTRIGRMANKAEQHSFDSIRVRLERQYRRSIQTKDSRLTLAVLDKMCKLYGLDKPIKIAPTTPDGENEYTGTPKEIGFRVRKLLEAALADDTQDSNGKQRV